MHQAQQFLDQQVDRVKQEGVSVAEAYLVRGRPDREVVHLSEEIGAGLIILGSRGLGGVRRALMGSVSDSVVRHAHCPVLIVRE
jgi:nucleotide-binding universal stress UspA family protein